MSLPKRLGREAAKKASPAPTAEAFVFEVVSALRASLPNGVSFGVVVRALDRCAHVRGELECPSRSMPAIEDGQGEPSRLRKLEARSREHSQPVHVDRVLAGGGIQKRLSFDGEQRFRSGARHLGGVVLAFGRMSR